MPKISLLSPNRLHCKMLEGHELLRVLNLNIDKLQAALNNANIVITQVCGADHYYTGGGAIGSFIKIYPLNFYYDVQGRPHYGCSGPAYDLYGAICNKWISDCATGVFTSVYV